MYNGPLPFWHFFEQLEKALSYERWLAKYKLFLHALYSGHIPFDDDWKSLRFFCKTLYLQNHRDEARFDALFDAARKKEESLIMALLQKKAGVLNQKTAPENHQKVEAQENPVTTATRKPEREPESNAATTEAMPQPEDENGNATRYYQPPSFELAEAHESEEEDFRYLHTDEYFTVTRRQMVKGWQFLRHKEKAGRTTDLDIRRTVRQVAKDGLFLEPVYFAGTANREDTLIIFADCHGSMAPFTGLANRLIQTAKEEGGHAKAPVFYFQNTPLGYVYRKSNLTSPVKVKEALLKANRNFTLAVVISDAGAARGNDNKERKAQRLKNTRLFLKDLRDTCAHIIWLNPMPAHRWRNTAAEDLLKEKFVMAPLLDDERYNFQDTLRTVLKQQKITLKL